MDASTPILTSPRKLGLRVEDFMLLDDNGAFDDYGKTELIDGDIYVLKAQHGPHARAKSRLAFALTTSLREIGSDLEVIIEVAVYLNGDTMPEPDIVVTRWRGKGAVPVESIALLVEVADTTLDRDTGRKLDLYAAAGVPEYWVVDVNEGHVLMHDQPQGNGYRERRKVPLADTLLSTAVNGLVVNGAELVR
ncbi:Uma2 family endonuclease [uncultured Sphingomonas sp.]|uniref:Uma2 family endonuclease n=1 Tax=uncultured Sphingomonas sp. TaxID=158754 RepID=UPI0035CA1D55